LLVVLGCRTPAARFATTAPDDAWLPCSVVFARQIAEDSVVETSCHPLRTGLTIAAQSAQGLWSLGCGAYGKRVAMPLAGPPPPLAEDRGRLDSAKLEAELDRLLGAPLQPAQVQLHPDGADALLALQQLIAGASRRIDVLMFQWENDALGSEIAGLLAAKAGPNLRVRILVDGGGNLIFGAPVHAHAGDVNGVVTKLATQPYVEMIRTRNPFGWVDHRKLVLVDGQQAWTGGRNFTHKSFFEQRDLSATLEGPVVTALAKDFDEFWEEQGGGKAMVDSKDNPPAASSDLPSRVRPVYTLPRRHQIEQMLYHVVDRAQHHIFIENYTFCDSLLVYKLAQARHRGVDVRVVLTFSDCTAALNRANRAIANRLLAAGVRVYVYPGMTHAKVAAVDGCWAYLGSGNFDPLSLRRNYELGLAFRDSGLVREIEQKLFQPDFCPAWELTAPLRLTFRDCACELLASLCL
jgi:cardiolipin synthase